MEYSKEQLNRLHLVEKDVLNEIIRVCDENGLLYFVDWGTLLGTVRHGGFIPWDDDIDISMPREDYEVFLRIAPVKLKEEYVLQHFSTEPLTPQYCAKVRKKGTRFVEEYAVNLPIEQGVFIDIYPIDKVPDDEMVSKKYQRRATFWKQLFISKVIRQPSYHKKFLKKVFFSIIRTSIFVMIAPIPRTYIFNKLNKHLQKYNNVECEKVSCIGTKRGEHYAKDVFPLRRMTFEDIEVLVPNEMDKVLRDEYGDYMQLPPADKRIGHCPAVFEV